MKRIKLRQLKINNRNCCIMKCLICSKEFPIFMGQFKYRENAGKTCSKSCSCVLHSKNIDKEWLYKKYVEERFSMEKIAKALGVSFSTVRRHMYKFNIPIRNMSEALKGVSAGKNNPMYGRKGKDNPRTGTKHSKKTLELMKKNRSGKCTGKNNPNYGGLSDKHRRNISKTRTVKGLGIGKLNGMYGKPAAKGAGYGKRIKYAGITFRSTYEVAFAKYLSKRGIKWDYEIKHFPIKLNDKDMTYTPDFYLLQEGKYVEIKGYDWENTKKKREAFVKQYPDIKLEVLFKKDLSSKYKIEFC